MANFAPTYFVDSMKDRRIKLLNYACHAALLFGALLPVTCDTDWLLYATVALVLVAIPAFFVTLGVSLARKDLATAKAITSDGDNVFYEILIFLAGITVGYCTGSSMMWMWLLFLVTELPMAVGQLRKR